ncbi:LppU/SCO3897 family protein [Amycolatopsis sp. TRM77291]
MTTTPTGGMPEYDPFNAPAPLPSMPEAVPPTPFPKPPPLSVLAKASIVLGVVVALGLGSLFAFAVSRSSGFTKVEAGKCLYLTDEAGGNQSYTTASCSSDRATFRVDEVRTGSSDCRSADYIQFELYGGSSSKRAEKTLCLALNVESGDCLRDVVHETRIAKVRCSDISAEARATVMRGSEAACMPEDTELRYTGPPVRTVCLRPTGENI